MKIKPNIVIKYNGKYESPGKVIEVRKEVADTLIEAGQATAVGKESDENEGSVEPGGSDTAI